MNGGLSPLSFELQKPAQLLSSDELEQHERAERRREAYRWLTESLSPDLVRMASQEMKTLVSPNFVPAMTGWRPEAGNLLLLGNTGAGKTVSAAFIFKRLVLNWARQSDEGLAQAKRVRWCTATQLGKARREEALGRCVDVLEKAKRARVLIIDDLGQDNNREDLFDVLYHRYFRRNPTIVTSGLKREELQKRFGAELWRRLTVCGRQRSAFAEDWRRA